jgi:chromate transport protein ChrA
MSSDTPLEVLRVFFKLGLSCFGGPIAHIGYFREEFVVRRRWLDEATYTNVVALCQFLPGPASSQVGFSIGLIRAGYPGALAAWVGFTLPSAIALVFFAYGASAIDGPIGAGLLHGLKLVAVPIVAQAIWGMSRTLCPDRQRVSIAVASALLFYLFTSSLAQLGVILLGGFAGLWLCRAATATAPSAIVVPVSRRAGIVCLASFFILLLGLPLAVTARRFCDTGMGHRRCLPGRVRRRSGRPGPPVHFCRVSRRRRRAYPARRVRSAGGDRWHLSSRYVDSFRYIAILGSAPYACRRAGGDAWCQRRSRWAAGRCFL